MQNVHHITPILCRELCQPILTQTKKIIKLNKERQHSYIRSVTNSAERTGNVGWKIQAAYSTADFTKKSAESYITLRSQMRTSPARQPDARISLLDGWKATHHGVRGCPGSTCVHLPVSTLVIRIVWSPCVEAIRLLQYAKNVHNQIVNLMHKKLSWCWQTHAMRLDVSQGHQTW